MNDPKESVNDSKHDTKKNNYNDETQVEENKENIINNSFPFKYLEKDNSPELLIFEGEEKPNIFETFQGKYDYSICILLKDDLQKSSKMLETTLNSIYDNRDSLSDLKISTSNILICIFVNEIRGYSLFNKDEFDKIKKEKNSLNTYLYLKAHKEGFISSDIFILTKPDYLSSVEALKFYYLGIISQIKLDNKIIFSSVITAGVELNKLSLKKLIINSYYAEGNKIKGAAVGLVLSSGEGIFSMVEQYERLHFNTYDMNFLGSSNTIPVSSLMSTIAIDDSNYGHIKNFYKTIKTNQSIDFHDYNLALELYQNDIKVTFVSDETIGELKYLELNYFEYQEIWVNRYSGYYGNFFELLKCYGANCNFIKIIFLTFQLIGLLIEFIYPALSTMVIYAIFYEAFDTLDYRISLFFIMIYICMLTAGGMCSLVSKNPQELKFANFFLYIFMEVYYVFVLICSIVAMDNINKNRNLDEYKFNKAAISCIIIFTFLPYIIPMLLNNNLFFPNILNMLTYIGLGASCSTSNFLIAEIWNAPDTAGGNQMEERKSITLIFFFLYNLFFGFLSVYNYTRRKRANCVMGLGIMFLIYNFIKIMAIIGNILGRKNLDSNSYSKIIDRIKNDLGKGGDNDLRSEEKNLKKSSQMYNSGFNYEENNNNYPEY
jgi:hypothetical protein